MLGFGILAGGLLPTRVGAMVQPENTLLFRLGQSALPADVSGYRAVAEGDSGALGVRADGHVDGWVGAEWKEYDPTITNAVDVAIGSRGWIVLLADGRIAVRGDEKFAPQAAGGGYVPYPVYATNIVAISAGFEHSLALASDGTVFGGGSDSSFESTPPGFVTNVVQILAGESYSAAIRADGSVVYWGAGFSGMLPGATNVIQIATDYQNVYALQTSGRILIYGATAPADNVWKPTLKIKGIAAVPGGCVALGEDSRIYTVASGPFVTSTTNDSVALPNAVRLYAQGHSWGAYLDGPLMLLASGDLASDPLQLPIGTNLALHALLPPIPGGPIQWYRDQVAIEGANTASLQLTNVQTETSGHYSVAILRPAGTRRSQTMELVVGRPRLVEDLSDVTVEEGLPIGLQFKAGANETVSYEWRVNGQPIVEWNAASHAFPAENIPTNQPGWGPLPATLAMSGSYQVVARTGSGVLESRIASVNVAPAPLVDVSQPFENQVWPLSTGSDRPEIAQTFVAGISGKLDRVDLAACYYNDQLEGAIAIEVRDVDAVTGRPGNRMLGHAIVRHQACALMTVSFRDQPVYLEAGVRYALVARIEDPEGVGNWYAFYGAYGTQYPDGTLWTRNANGGTWQEAISGVTGATVDLLFVTHMFPGIPSVWIAGPRSAATGDVQQPMTFEAGVAPGLPPPSSVVFRVDGHDVGTATTAPYTAAWTPSVAGDFTLVAAATASGGVETLSASVGIRIREGRPSNDDFTERRALVGSWASDDFTLAGATTEAGEPSANLATTGRTVWWTWTAPFSGNCSATIAPSSGDWSIGFFTGPSAETVEMAEAGLGRCDFPVVAGRTYRIAVDSRDAGATSGTLKLALNDLEFNSPAPKSHYKSPGTVQVSAQRQAGATRNLAHVRLLLDGQEAHDWASSPYSATLTVAEPGSHEIVAVSVDTAGVETRSRPVSFVIRPANDRFADAIQLVGSDFVIQTSNAGATTETGALKPRGEPLFGDNQGGHSIWYRWTAPRDGVCFYHAEGLPQGVMVNAYIGTDPAALGEIANNAFGRAGDLFGFNARAGQSYVFMVDGLFGEQGALTWTMDLVAGNDFFNSRTPIPGDHYEEIIQLAGSIFEPGEARLAPAGALGSRWWTWRAPQSGMAHVSFRPDSGTAAVGVSTGTWIKGLVPVGNSGAPGTDAEYSWLAEAGNVYQIAVFTAGQTDGNGRLVLDFGAVHLLSPSPGAVLPVGVPVVLEARLDSIGNAAAGIDFTANHGTVASAASAPYLQTWVPTQPGNYALRAVAHDASGMTFRSDPVRVLVIEGEDLPKPRLFADPNFTGTMFIDASENVHLLGNSIAAFGNPVPVAAGLTQVGEWPAGVTRWKSLTTTGVGGVGYLALSDDGRLYYNGETPMPLPPGVNRFVKLSGSWGSAVAVGDDGRLYGNGITAWDIDGRRWADGGVGPHNSTSLGEDGTFWVHDFGIFGQPLHHEVEHPAGAGRWVKMVQGIPGVLLLDDRHEVYFFSYKVVENTTIAVTELIGRPAGVTAWKDAAFGGYHFMALSADGHLWASGRNQEGQLGSGDAPGDYSGWHKVVEPPGVTAWIAFAAGGYHSMAVGNDCTLYAWGWNAGGELGMAPTSPIFFPTRVPTIGGVCGSMLVFSRNAAQRLSDGTFRLAFETVLNRQYIVQYSDDLALWKTAFPPIVGNGGSVEWIDNGPPATDSSPVGLPGRWYRILLAP